MFLNIHTHIPPAPGQISILNVLSYFDRIPGSGFFSAGLHPWYLENDEAGLPTDPDTAVKLLGSALQKKNVLAAGECGLDKVCATPYHLQETIFRSQIQMAAEVKKPLIIHCVKAYDDVLLTLKEMKVEVPVIFHGFNKSAGLAAQLLKAGYYLSFGKHLLQAATAAVFEMVPMDRVFLETDAAGISIEDIYGAAAASKKSTVTELSEQININAQKVFGINFS